LVERPRCVSLQQPWATLSAMRTVVTAQIYGRYRRQRTLDRIAASYCQEPLRDKNPSHGILRERQATFVCCCEDESRIGRRARIRIAS
jgi:hypothetical protein